MRIGAVDHAIRRSHQASTQAGGTGTVRRSTQVLACAAGATRTVATTHGSPTWAGREPTRSAAVFPDRVRRGRRNAAVGTPRTLHVVYGATCWVPDPFDAVL